MLLANEPHFVKKDKVSQTTVVPDTEHSEGVQLIAQKSFVVHPNQPRWVDITPTNAGGGWIEGYELEDLEVLTGPCSETDVVQRVRVQVPEGSPHVEIEAGRVLGMRTQGTPEKFKQAQIVIEFQQELQKGCDELPEKIRQCKANWSERIAPKDEAPRTAADDDPTHDAGSIGEDYKFPDPETKEYKEKLRAALEEQRPKRYSHLPPKWWAALLLVLLTFSSVLWIEGSPPGRLHRFLFDLELKEGAKVPPSHQPSKLGPGEKLREQYHLRKGLEQAQLVRPLGVDVGEMASRVRVVPKPGEDKSGPDEQLGRLIFDYRDVNNITKEEPAEMEDADALTRWLASKLWRSTGDLLAGFNHLVLTKRAARLMQVSTSLGILQPCVLGFGVHGGPAAMQKCVNTIFRQMRDDGLLRIFIDDLALGTGEAGSLTDPVDDHCKIAEAAFYAHLET